MRSLTLFAAAVVFTRAWIACSDDSGNQLPNPDLLGPDMYKYKLDINWLNDRAKDAPKKTDAPQDGPAQADGAAISPAIISPAQVPGSSCKDGWVDTGQKSGCASGSMFLQYLQLGIGSGADPEVYACKPNVAKGTTDAYLYEKDCNDTTNIGLTCGGVCMGKGVTKGLVLTFGSDQCHDGWKPTKTNLGAGKNCKAFIGYARLGKGSGAEPNKFGCRYNATTGDIETYLYEKGCDDKAKTTIWCNWICWDAGVAQSGPVTLGGGLCKQGWQTAGPNVGAGKKCTVGIEYMQLGVGSGPEPDRYGCRYNSTTGQMEAQLYEKSCDDKAIKIDCGYICFK